MTLKRRVAIAGAGIGGLHLNGYKKLLDRYEVAVICDLDSDRASSLADQVGAAVSTDLENVITDPSIDILDICLPPTMHEDVAIRAMQAGKDVILEKPIAASRSGVNRLRHSAAETGRTISPVFQYRYGKAMEQVRAVLNSGFAGRPLIGSMETHWNRGPDYYAVQWRGKKTTEIGGVVLGHVIHMHDLACEIMGPVEKLSAMLATRVNDIETEDCGAIQMQMMSGALISSSVTLGAATDTTSMRFLFENVTMASGLSPYEPMEDGWTFTARGNADQAALDAITSAVEKPLSGFAGYLSAFADSLDGYDSGHRPKAVSLDDGARSIAVADAIYRSSHSGQVETV